MSRTMRAKKERRASVDFADLIAAAEKRNRAINERYHDAGRLPTEAQFAEDLGAALEGDLAAAPRFDSISRRAGDESKKGGEEEDEEEEEEGQPGFKDARKQAETCWAGADAPARAGAGPGPGPGAEAAPAEPLRTIRDGEAAAVGRR